MLNNFFTTINLICLIPVVHQIIDTFKNFIVERNNINLLELLVEIGIILFIFYYVYYNKKLITNTFDLLKELIQNNKLHTLREVVMVANKQHTKKTNPCCIEKGIFRYKLSYSSDVQKPELSNYFNVEYEIQLSIKYNHLKGNDNLLKFYLILDSCEQKFMYNIPVTINLTSSIEVGSLKFNVLPQSVTTSGMDHIDLYAGLYEISFQIPKKWAKNTITCTISYCIYKNILLTTNTDRREYNFAILPANYGRKFKKIEIEVSAPKTLDINITSQRICIGKAAEKAYDFISKNDIDNNLFSLTSKYFTPKINAIYFTQLTRIK